MGRRIRCAVPVVLNVIEVQLDDRPQVLGDPGRVPILDEPVGVKDECRGPQCRTVPLGPTYVVYSKSQWMVKAGGMGRRTPRTGESGLVDVELGFTQAAGVRGTAGIGQLLDVLLRKEKLVDLPAE